MAGILNVQVTGLTVKFSLADNAVALINPFLCDEVGVPMEYMDMIEKWCFTEHCGIRVGLSSFRMDTDEQLSYFLMRWS